MLTILTINHTGTNFCMIYIFLSLYHLKVYFHRNLYLTTIHTKRHFASHFLAINFISKVKNDPDVKTCSNIFEGGWFVFRMCDV